MLVAPIKDITKELRICSSDYCQDPCADREMREGDGINPRLENWVQPGAGSAFIW
jgi:hypothetical protein